MCYYILTSTPFKSELKLAVKVGNLQILLFGIEMPAATSNGEIVNKMKVFSTIAFILLASITNIKCIK